MIKVLLHNDDPGMRQALLRALDNWGYQGIELTSVRSAYVVAVREAPNVVILGARELTGDLLSILRELRSDPATSAIPVIVLASGEIDEALVREQHGAFDCLSDRWTFEQLRARLQAALARPSDQ